ncbi:aminotransferase class I/II-fold pyridoxal phosphate-dependent enzyme [Gracilibacillus caseinilyticus]|uniref:Aminotransferase class I/II-fold pyridoxal phosphate-dependent enzyme n=1 Tax=Gracilibacillus caseinilyticus TaxID=2932256 RepID=A0ABY4EZ30_9BACI|nr:aminotransferase class I/II-fold pyridoxal phosphate-dependent enzyme [Gracilibacillus caseinilyticus]UOQ49545.1 aminotransferase class I/II-fold pyridoxal phosphate-dependent enzyme [Gracilibacillus caseinilyticus]
MMLNQSDIPLYQAIKSYKVRNNHSFHVPGHKNGNVFVSFAKSDFLEYMQMDLTELDGLDDLHAPDGVIEQAQALASDWFQSRNTYFLVNGSTVGNLAMIMATCQPGEEVLVQRNCHKSILHGMELAGVRPIFLPPQYDRVKKRYTNPSQHVIHQAIEQYPAAKALMLTYPDYFGETFRLEDAIFMAHQHNIIVLVDEAHGCHFSIPHVPKRSAVELGADIVIHSAHKMTPAFTMAAFLHVQTERVDQEKLRYYLQMLQSSSPSYPIMASLDLARYYLAHFSEEHYQQLQQYVMKLRSLLGDSSHWTVEESDDPLKISLRIINGNTNQVKKLFQKEKMYPELTTDNHLLLVIGLEPVLEIATMKAKVLRIDNALSFSSNHATIIESTDYFHEEITRLARSYADMRALSMRWSTWEKAIGEIAAEAIIPYPPGIPLLVKGEKISTSAVRKVKQLMNEKISIQPLNRENGLYIFDGSEGE